MNVVFLDFDGVVNIPMWRRSVSGEFDCDYSTPQKGVVNHYQAIQWVSEFCQKYGYDIVVSSTWRYFEEFDYAKCLYHSGLRNSIKVLGATPINREGQRGDEITAWLNEHPEVENYLIFDDDSDMGTHMDRLVKCNCHVGFMIPEYDEAKSKHEKFCGMAGL